MPFIPHTTEEVSEMLAVLEIKHTDELFSEIPKELFNKKKLDNLPALNEYEVYKLFQELARIDSPKISFLGAGAYKHNIPSAIWPVVTRGEFYSAYTPYQAEASQGSLQIAYEFQSMITELNAMDLSNSSLYEGASALVEAILMVHRKNNKSAKKILIARSLHPHYRSVATSMTSNTVELEEVLFDMNSGCITPEILNKINANNYCAIVLAQPNFFGKLEDVDLIVNWAHEHGLKLISVINPMSIGILKPAGKWGNLGADIAVGEAQCFGIPLCSGGPYLGFISAKAEYTRIMPGRIVGKTVCANNNTAYVLTLQTREQHIKRSNATSNICTNQGLMMIAATMYLALLGPEGIRSNCLASHNNMARLISAMEDSKDIKTRFGSTDYFHETVFSAKRFTPEFISELANKNLLIGLELSSYYPELENCILSCTTEATTDQDIDTLISHINSL